MNNKQTILQSKQNFLSPAAKISTPKPTKKNSFPSLRKENSSLSKFRDEKQQVKSFKQRLQHVEKTSSSGNYQLLIFGSNNYDQDKLIQHLTSIYRGVFYSSFILGSPSEEYLSKKMVRLPESKNNGQKFLILDLDQTLIHSVEDHQQCQVELLQGAEKIRFNVRPFCSNFLEMMHHFFEIYIFTSSLQEYARPIVNYLNSKHKIIQHILTRKHCLETKNGMMIKDLRIIKNRDLSKIVLVDNFAHSFGLQLENGIPILAYTNNKKDNELLGLTKFLNQIKDVSDVRPVLRESLAIKDCLEHHEEEFVKLRSRAKNSKKRTSYL